MKIWITRHGRTRLNKNKLMQGHLNEPLCDEGREQARKASAYTENIKFDAVYSSPLDRAIETAEIIGRTDRSDIIIDDRIIEVDFGNYESCSYYKLGPAMTLFWLLPEVFPAPKTVESVPSMVKRTSEFLRELEQKDYENVLVVCHGGIIRALCGYLEDRKNGIKWRPKPKNCEIRVYESVNGSHKFIADLCDDKEK
jgi:broad specificity phosphatase PhoE